MQNLGYFAAAAGKTKISGELVDSFPANGSNGSTLTRTVSLGKPDPSRVIVVMFSWQRATSYNPGERQAKLGGLDMEQLFVFGGNYMPNGGYSIHYPNGTTAELILQPGHGYYGTSGVTIYALYGLDTHLPLDVQTFYLNSASGSPILTNDFGAEGGVMLCSDAIYKSGSYNQAFTTPQGSAPVAAGTEIRHNNSYTFAQWGWVANDVPPGDQAWQYTYAGGVAYRRAFQMSFGKPKGIKHTASYTNGGNGSTFTSGNLSLGYGVKDRLVCVEVNSFVVGAAGELPPVSGTIAGIPATIYRGQYQNDGGSNPAKVDFMVATVPAGVKTGTVSVSFAGTHSACRMNVYEINLPGVNPVPTIYQGAGDASSKSVALGPVTGSKAVAVCGAASMAQTVTSWTVNSTGNAVTKDDQGSPRTNCTSLAGHMSDASGEPTITITPASAGVNLAAAVAVFE